MVSQANLCCIPVYSGIAAMHIRTKIPIRCSGYNGVRRNKITGNIIVVRRVKNGGILRFSGQNQLQEFRAVFDAVFVDTMGEPLLDFT